MHSFILLTGKMVHKIITTFFSWWLPNKYTTIGESEYIMSQKNRTLNGYHNFLLPLSILFIPTFRM